MSVVRSRVNTGNRLGRSYFAILVLVAVTSNASLALESSQSRATELVERVYVLDHRSAGEVLAEIYPLLSDRGTVFVEAGANILTIQDYNDILSQISNLIATLDRPAGRVQLEFQLVQAALGKSKEAVVSALPTELVVRLGQLLRYRSFRLLAESMVAVEDREDVELKVGLNYRVGFRLQSENPEERIRLEGFQLYKLGSDLRASSLIHTHLDLQRGKPMVLGLAKTETSPEALVVVINYRAARDQS